MAKEMNVQAVVVTPLNYARAHHDAELKAWRTNTIPVVVVIGRPSA